MPDSIPPVTGVNGKILIYEPNSVWKIWALAEIYRGTTDSGVYVPKVKDFVVDYDTVTWYRVNSVDATTYIPDLEEVHPVDSGEPIDDYDIILAQGPGSVYDTHRAYLDTSVSPFSLALEHRNYIHGSMARYAKIYRGSVSNVSEYRVISMFYDTGGNFLGDQIPLELVNMPNAQNFATYSIPPCKTSEDMPDGEILTVVIFSDTGHVVSKDKFVVERSAYIRAVNDSIKYVSHIALESDFLSGTDPNTILYPINVPLNSLNLVGVVYYSDGSTLRLPVDNTRFKVFGLDNFVATIVGQEVPIVITYVLAQDEVAYGTSVGETHHISETYKAKTVDADGQYAVKLFGYPIWKTSASGYSLKWFMANLDRTKIYDVTPLVHLNANGPAFDPILYGATQNLSMSLNLADVSGTFSSYIHTQTIGISLMAAGTDPATNWTISFAPGQNPVFGLNNQIKSTFVNSNLSYLDITCGMTTQADWLQNLFYNTKPLFNPASESQAPLPNFFAILNGTNWVEYPVSEWQNMITFNGLVNNLDTMFIKFFLRTPDNDIQLSIAGVPIHQVN